MIYKSILTKKYRLYNKKVLTALCFLYMLKTNHDDRAFKVIMNTFKVRHNNILIDWDTNEDKKGGDSMSIHS